MNNKTAVSLVAAFSLVTALVSSGCRSSSAQESYAPDTSDVFNYQIATSEDSIACTKDHKKVLGVFSLHPSVSDILPGLKPLVKEFMERTRPMFNSMPIPEEAKRQMMAELMMRELDPQIVAELAKPENHKIIMDAIAKIGDAAPALVDEAWGNIISGLNAEDLVAKDPATGRPQGVSKVLHDAVVREWTKVQEKIGERTGGLTVGLGIGLQVSNESCDGVSTDSAFPQPPKVSI